VIDAGGRIGRNFAPERQQENVSLFGAWPTMFEARAEGPGGVRLYSEGARERLRGCWRMRGSTGAVTINPRIPIGKRGLHLAVWALEQGFEGRGSRSSPNRTCSATG
jgi:transcription-repair coupling factor (superfamily II helicase)